MGLFVQGLDPALKLESHPESAQFRSANGLYYDPGLNQPLESRAWTHPWRSAVVQRYIQLLQITASCTYLKLRSRLFLSSLNGFTRSDRPVVSGVLLHLQPRSCLNR